MKNNGWKSCLCLEIMVKMNRFALLNFKIFWGQCPQTHILGVATAPLPRPHPLGTPALRASVPRSGSLAPPKFSYSDPA